MSTDNRAPRWSLVLVLIALGTFVAIWAGWVQLGAMTGFGWMHPLPGIIPGLRLDAVITLPVSVEAYGAYALGVWLSGRPVPERARSFARWSAIGALALGWTGQAASHVLTAAHVAVAPWGVTVLVSSVPVGAFGLAVALTHLLRAHPEGGESAPGEHPAPVTAPVLEPWSAPLPGTSGNGAHPVAAKSAAAERKHPERTRSAPAKSARTAHAEFAAELASGSLPSQRSVQKRMHVGWDRAGEIRAELEQVISGQDVTMAGVSPNGNGGHP